MAQTSFQRDILPLFERWRNNMIWRFDLTSYDQVKGNAAMIFERIGEDMPPPPYPLLTPQQVALFRQWMDEDCPP